jgi:uncharacterized protein
MDPYPDPAPRAAADPPGTEASRPDAEASPPGAEPSRPLRPIQLPDPPQAARLERLVRGSAWFLRVLEAARACAAPDCWVGAGALRDLVWGELHGGFRPELVKDVDVAFFDADDLRRERDQGVEDELTRLLPGVRWDAKNQAAVHLWYERRFGAAVSPLRSTADGVATWPETATAVAVRLARDGRLEILAPCGLADLLDGVCRRNPRRVTVAEYRRRIAAKRIHERWPSSGSSTRTAGPCPERLRVRPG